MKIFLNCVLRRVKRPFVLGSLITAGSTEADLFTSHFLFASHTAYLCFDQVCLPHDLDLDPHTDSTATPSMSLLQIHVKYEMNLCKNNNNKKKSGRKWTIVFTEVPSSLIYGNITPTSFPDKRFLRGHMEKCSSGHIPSRQIWQIHINNWCNRKKAS